MSGRRSAAVGIEAIMGGGIPSADHSFDDAICCVCTIESQ